MTNAPIHYLLVGLPYSGKTTLAKALVKEFGWEHISIDRIKSDMGYGSAGDDDVPDEAWSRIFTEADRRLGQYLSEGKTVVNEYAWVTRAWRDRARKIADAAGAGTRIIYLNIPKDVIVRRFRENAIAETRFQWPEKEFDQYVRDFEPPTADEDVLIFSQTIPQDVWIRQNVI